MSQGDQDKTEEPTRHRLDEARKRGEAAKSIDVAGAVVMIVAAATLGLIGPRSPRGSRTPRAG